jgi:hypothetical protein
VRPANEYRGSIVGLSPETNYEVQVTAGAATASITVSTWTESENLPIGTTVLILPHSSLSTLQDHLLDIDYIHRE